MKNREKVMHVAIKDMVHAQSNVDLLKTHKHLTGKSFNESNRELRSEGYKLRNKRS